MSKNYILEYIDKIESGEIITSKKVKQMYAKIKPIVLGEDDTYYYDERKGNRPIQFLETFCKQSKGKWHGKTMELLLFQKAKIQSVFGILHRDTGFRKFKEVFDVRARKNGKTQELAGLGLYLMIADGEMGAEIYSAATNYSQAKRVWDESKNMINQSFDLASVLRSRTFPDSEILMDSTMSVYKPLSKNVRSADGLNASAAIIDEVHELPRAIYDILKQSMSVREQPLLNMITTAGFVREGLFDDTYSYASKVLEGTVEDETLFALIYELDSEDEMYDEDMWIKANPAIDIIKNRDSLRQNVEKMKSDLNFANTVKVKDFNIINVEEHAWLTYDDFNNDTIVDISKYNNTMAIGGFDLSRTGDLTAFSTLFYDKELDKFVFDTMYWMPEAKFKELESGKIPYRQWVDRGLIRLCPGNIIDYKMISEYVYHEMVMGRGITYMKIHYDAYSATYLVKEFESMGFSQSVMIRTQQGYKTLSIPMQTLGSHLQEKRVIYQNNPVTKWNLSNVELVQDRNGNYMPKKMDDKRERKIDGAATMINCYVGLVDNYDSFISMY